MSLSQSTLYDRSAHVIKRILSDGAVTNLSATIKRCRAALDWPESEDEELRLYLVEHLSQNNRHKPLVRIMNERRAAKRRKATQGDNHV